MKFIHNRQSGRRGGGQCDSAEDKSQINRNIRCQKYNCKYKCYKGKGSKGLRQRCDNQSFPVVFEFFPHKLRSEHQSERALHPHDNSFIPR